MRLIFFVKILTFINPDKLNRHFFSTILMGKARYSDIMRFVARILHYIGKRWIKKLKYKYEPEQ